jgi:M3 family oligoendopeptidase
MVKRTLSFKQIDAARPDFDALARAYAATERTIEAATSESEARAAVGQWDQLRRDYETWSSLVHLHFEQDTRSEQYKQDRMYRDELNPRVQELDTKIKRLMLDRKRREQLEPIYGRQCFAIWDADVLTYEPAIQQDLVREARLEADYTELLASAQIDFAGERHNLSSIIRFRQLSDRRLRHDAEAALWAWTAGHGEKLDAIYGELVVLRDEMAKKLGFHDFIGLGYKRMKRVDYDQADVERFRAGVREHVVPLAAELTRRQAARLGVDRLMFWDEALHDNRDNPAPAGDHDWMIERATEMFDAMGPLGPFFRIMRDGDFLDLKTREGKAFGGFCTSFPSYGMPFIFANFNGSKHDVEVFTHEMGHAFQNYESRSQPLVDYHWPTSDSCEIHSMSLEYLTWPHMEKFFQRGDERGEADRFRRMHLVERLAFLPYGVAIDHFQHLIAAEPQASPERRHELWREMEQMYLPWRDYGDLAYAAKGGRRQLQRHIYGAPFYYIDYTLAETCAMQFCMLAQDDPVDALDRYVALCRRGGEAPFQELAHSAGLVSPFDEGCIGDVVNRVRVSLLS